MTNDAFHVSVGMSRKWDAREAGREVIQSTLNKLDEDPSFVILFPTIHYEKFGGFKELLQGAKEILPEKTLLIGGTVSGFMNNFGCFTRGVSSIAISSSDIQFKVGIGKDTKKNPQKAVNTVFNQLKENKKYRNNVNIEILPTAVIPKLPGMGQKNVIYSKKMGNSFIKLLPAMTKLNYGFDRADEILEMLSEKFQDDIIIGGCTMDDNKMLKNYQFYNTDVKENSLLLLSISTPVDVYVETILGYKILEKKFKIDDISKDQHVINKIDGKGARTALFEKLNLSIDQIDSVYQLYKNAFYYPLGFKKDDLWHAGMIGLIYGENLIFANQIKDNNLTLLSLSIEKIFENIMKSIENIKNNDINFILGFSCETFIETLGKNIFKIHNLFSELNIPFLIPFVAGESIYTPSTGSHHLYESMNLIAF
jgi:hypothetical protein